MQGLVTIFAIKSLLKITPINMLALKDSHCICEIWNNMVLNRVYLTDLLLNQINELKNVLRILGLSPGPEQTFKKCAFMFQKLLLNWNFVLLSSTLETQVPSST